MSDHFSPSRLSSLALVQSAQAGDRAAMQALLDQNDGLIGHVLNGFQRTMVDREDLLQEARLGFLMAIQRFDPTRNCRFSTVACSYMRNRVVIALRQQSHLIRLPWRVWADRRRLWSAGDRLYLALGREPEVEELAEETGYTVSRVRRALNAALVSHSLEGDTLLPTADREGLIDGEDTTMEAVLHLLDQEILTERIAAMGEPYMTLIAHRYELGGTPFMTWEQLGVQLQANRRQVHEWHDEALEYLRAHLEVE